MLERLLGRLVANAVTDQVTGSGLPLPGLSLGQLPGLSGMIRGGRLPGLGWGFRRPRLNARNALMGLGVLGAAYAAYEHFSKSGQPSSPTTPSPTGGVPPPLPPSVAVATVDADPRTLLLLRTMIAAANADLDVDEREKQAIATQAGLAGLAASEATFLAAEMARPMTPDALAAAAPPDLARDMYAAALLAIVADTDVERAWLARLGKALGLDEATRQALDAQLGRPA